jgi:hypothetical protein
LTTSEDLTMTKHTPATPLPWKPWTKRIHHEIYAANDQIVAQVRQCEGPNGSTHQDAAYIAHAANAYPKLVAALRLAANGLDTTGQTTKQSNDARNHARALLRELGEE